MAQQGGESGAGIVIAPREAPVAQAVLANYVCEARLITFPAPYAVQPGDGFLVGMLFAVATRSAQPGDAVEGMIQGVFHLPKRLGETWDNGIPVYWVAAERRLSVISREPPIDHKFIGYGLTKAAAEAATGVVAIGIAGTDVFGKTQAAS